MGFGQFACVMPLKKTPSRALVQPGVQLNIKGCRRSPDHATGDNCIIPWITAARPLWHRYAAPVNRSPCAQPGEWAGAEITPGFPRSDGPDV